jgi:hypothetical protein
MMGDLKNCPFCGGEALFIVQDAPDGGEYISVCCTECKTAIFRPRFDKNEDNMLYRSRLEAALAWNNRTEGKGNG